MVDLVHAAFAAAKVRSDATPDDLTPLLTSAGLLAVASGDTEVFTIPAFIRILMRRITAGDDAPAKRTPREALGMAIADIVGRQRADSREGLPELLDLVLEIRDWKVLERGWARRSVNIFLDAPTSIEAFLSVPEAVVAKNPILALARSAARRIDSTRQMLGTEDPEKLLSATDFDSIVVPEMHGRLTDPSLRLSGDEVAVLTMLEARSHRLNRKYELALKVIEVGRKRMLSLGDGEPGPTLMPQAELSLERGRSLVAAGRFTEAMSVLQSVVHFAGIYTPNSPHPLLAGLVETALAGLGHGHGSDMDHSLERARESAARFGLDTLPDERTALSVELLRSLDRLDLDTAEGHPRCCGAGDTHSSFGAGAGLRQGAVPRVPRACVDRGETAGRKPGCGDPADGGLWERSILRSRQRRRVRAGCGGGDEDAAGHQRPDEFEQPR
jgi:hypothetical protein